MFVLDHIVYIKLSLENQFELIHVIQHEYLFHINLIMVLQYQQIAIIIDEKYIFDEIIIFT
jgi:hypothetical protein